jgi:hypothetical protein
MNRNPGDIRTNGEVRELTPHLSRKLCLICQCRLTVHQEVRGGVCDRLECHRKRMVEIETQRLREEAAALERTAAEHCAKIAPLLGIADAASLRVTVIPYFHRKVVKLSRRRRSEFRTHVANVLREAFEGKFDPAAVTNLKIELMSHARESSDEPALGSACAVCTGFCCRNGGTHAYLDVAVIRSYMARHPGMRLGAVLKAYMSNLPDATYDGSCVYHGSSGCGLPREMRASECNDYFCDGLASLRKDIAEEGPKTVFLAVAEGQKIMDAAVIEPDGKTVRMRASREER